MIKRMIKQGRQLDEPSSGRAQDLASGALPMRRTGASRSHECLRSVVFEVDRHEDAELPHEVEEVDVLPVLGELGVSDR